MLVITLGTIASGSTWAFNVVRALFAQSRPNAVSLSAGDASDLFNNVPAGSHDVIVKAHYLDRWLLTLASLFEAKIVVTTRDPRDSLVSQRERFGATLQEAIRDLSRSSATLAMIDGSLPLLNLRYEDRFMDDVTTVERIASFLELPVGKAERDLIFDENRPEAVARKVDRWLSLGKLKALGFDETSHWHEGHVGDGECGKWRQRLAPDDQEAVIGALGSDLSHFEPPKSIFWSPKLFTYFDERSGADTETFECRGEEQPFFWGPYQHLPAGRWRIAPRIELEGQDCPITVRIDTFIPVPGRDVIALRIINLPAASPERLVMEFDHHDHLEPLELRLSAIADGRCGRIRFRGADLSWLGPSERAATLAARPVVMA